MGTDVYGRSAIATVLSFLIFAFINASAASQPIGRQPNNSELPIEIIPSVGRTAISPVSISAQGDLMSVAGGTGSQLWNLVKGRLVRNYLGLSSQASCAAMSPDGMMIAAADPTGSVGVWDIQSGRMLSLFPSEMGFVNRIMFSRDSRRVIYAGSQKPGGTPRAMFIKDIGGRTIKAIESSNRTIESLDVSADGRLIAIGSFPGIVRIFSSDGDPIRTFTAHGSTKSLGRVYALAFSPDGKWMATGGGDNSVKIWDLSSGVLMRTLAGHTGNDGLIQSVAWSPDGKNIATLDWHTLRLWNPQTGALLKSATFRDSDGEQDYLSTLSYLPDGGSLILNGQTIIESKELAVRHVLDGAAVTRISDGARVSSTKVTLVGASPRSLLDLDLVTGKLEKRYLGPQAYWQADVSRDGKQILGLNENSLTHIDLSSAAPGKELTSSLKDAWAFSISPDGAYGAVKNEKGIELYDLKSDRRLRAWKGADEVYKLAFSPDAKLLASATFDSIQLWQMPEAKLLYKAKTSSGADSIRFAPDGRSIIAIGLNSSYYSAASFDVTGLRPLQKFELQNVGSNMSATNFSPDGRSVAIGSFDAVIRLWDVNSGRIEQSYNGHRDAISDVVFSSDGKRIVSSAADGIKVWDRESGTLLITQIASPAGEWVAITPEGFFDASVKGAAKLSVVRGLEVYSIDQVYQALYRPDLVREKLAGDPKGLVRDAAAKLDLNKVMASGAAPRVSIVTPSGNVGGDEATVEASIAEQNGGGIGRIEWRVNGVTLGVESRGVQRLPEGAGSAAPMSRPPVMVKRTLALEPGENRIEIVAYNGRDLIASDPAHVILKWDGEKSATPPKLHVLAVAVNDYYDSRLRLSYAVPDAQALGEALKQAGGSLYQSVDVTSVLDDKVTADNLDQVFADLGEKVHPRDVFVFFLAGHGKTVDGRYHFLPQNFRYEDESSIVKRGIDQERFQAWFAKIPARKSILLYDTCESDSLTGDRVQQRGIERVAALEKMTRAMGRTVLSASSDDAPALEGYKGHGVFTYALLDGLQAADTNGNGLIEVTELAAFVDQKVPDLSYQAFKMRQIPQMKIVGNSFAVVSKTSVLQASDATTTSAPVPTKPTHVVSPSPIEVYMAAARGGAVVTQLSPGTTVTIIEGANGWQLIAKDGKKLGFVEDKGLLKLQ